MHVHAHIVKLIQNGVLCAVELEGIYTIKVSRCKLDIMCNPTTQQIMTSETVHTEDGDKRKGQVFQRFSLEYLIVVAIVDAYFGTNHTGIDK